MPFVCVLILAKIVDRGFVPPERNKVSGPIMDIIYQQVQVRGKTSLLSEASLFGLACLGDGATVKRMPLINILLSSSNNPTAVLEIKDFSKHMSEGGNKYKPYIADIFINHLRVHGNMNQIVDLLFSDGAP